MKMMKMMKSEFELHVWKWDDGLTHSLQISLVASVLREKEDIQSKKCQADTCCTLNSALWLHFWIQDKKLHKNVRFGCMLQPKSQTQDRWCIRASQQGMAIFDCEKFSQRNPQIHRLGGLPHYSNLPCKVKFKGIHTQVCLIWSR